MRKFRRRKSGREPYFTSDTQAAIIEYRECDDRRTRERIYRDRIHYAFSKLAEYNLRVYDWQYYLYETPYEDAHIETVAYLVEKIDMFNQNNEKGSTAYSYYNAVVRNFLIQKNKAAYIEIKRRESVDVIDTSRDLLNEKFDIEQKDTLSIFFDEFISKMENELVNHFPDRNELMIADALLELFKYRENIEDFKKKTIYLMVKEITGVRTETITPVVRKMKGFFDIYKEYYDKNNHLDTSGSFW